MAEIPNPLVPPGLLLRILSIIQHSDDVCIQQLWASSKNTA